MGTEIERKFLVRDVTVVAGAEGIPYRQGYLSTVPERTVRVRLAGPRAFLTVKGITVGDTRSEFEYEIPVADAMALLRMCERPLVEKTRYRVEHAGLTWEVDIFEGDNAGLIVAEVELPASDTPVELPDWIGEEVTGDPRYYNANLVARPFTTWRSAG
jgi:adenylate cyclase